MLLPVLIQLVCMYVRATLCVACAIRFEQGSGGGGSSNQQRRVKPRGSRTASHSKQRGCISTVYTAIDTCMLEVLAGYMYIQAVLVLSTGPRILQAPCGTARSEQARQCMLGSENTAHTQNCITSCMITCPLCHRP
eukprot:4810-Heterococcus_DN1.PRE.3